jgi:hypothetical protein
MLENIDDASLPVWKEKYPDTMVIGAMLRKNVYLKPCTRKQNDSNNCKYSLRRDHSYCCDVYCNLFNVLE